MENKYEYDVSVVLAIYNEEECVKEELEIINNALKKSKFTYEIIAINDKSTDSTLEILKEIPYIKLINHKINQGSGGSRKTGTLAAKGKYVIWSDADMTYPNEVMPELVQFLIDNDHDQVVGARRHEMGTKRFLRVPAKLLLRKLAMFLSGVNIPDLNSGLRVFKRDVAMNYLYLLPKGFSCVTTITLSFLMNGHDVAYFPIEYKTRVGVSKFHPIKDTYRYLIQIIRMIMYFNPLKVFITLFSTFSIISILSAIRSLWVTHSLQQIDIMLFMIAMNCLLIGFLADLVNVQGKKK